MSDMQEEFNDQVAKRPLCCGPGTGAPGHLLPRGLSVGQELEALRNRITELEDLLRSAHAIAKRQGADTHWARFAASIQRLGIGSITARVYKLDRAGGLEDWSTEHERI